MKTRPTGHAPTDAWLAKQPIWYDRDIIKATLMGIAFGVMFGLATTSIGRCLTNGHNPAESIFSLTCSPLRSFKFVEEEEAY